MKYRKLDSTGDYTLGLGTQNFLTDADAVAQAIKTNLLLLQGEWWEDTSIGLPLFQNILGQSGSLDSQKSVDLLVRTKILNTSGVIDILSYTSSYENRKYTISCTVNTQFGAVMVSVPLTVAY